MARAYIGTSGWNYKHWSNGVFYPKDLKPADWLQFFARHFETVEINNSFYRLPSEAAFQNWRKQAPEHCLRARHYGQAGGGNYGKKELDRDIDQIRTWLASDLDVYVYFNNDVGGHALRNAQYVKRALSQR